MAKYKAYPEYKDSGMEWCTALPLGWKRTNLRWLSSIYAGGTPSKNVIDYWENGTIPWINSGAVNQSYVTEPSTFISKAAFENSSAKWIPKGALVVALAGQGKTKGMVAQLGINTTCNQSMAAIVFYEKNLSRYIYWWLTSNYQNIRNMAGGDLRDGLNLELLGDIQCPQPNDGECIRISAFLDHETAKIDKLIEKQQQLIELLKEKRQAVISHAVTKGLNPDVPMKDSGVEWLGSVPEHWTIKPLRYLGDCQNGINIGAEAFGSGFPFVSYGDAYKNRVLPENGSGLVQSTAVDRRKYSLLRGDVLFTRTSETIEEIGFASACIKSIENACFAGFLIRFRPTSSDLCIEYSKYYFSNQLLRIFFTKEMNLITRASLSQDLLKTMPVVIPPVDEQIKIAELLDSISKKFDQLQLLGEEQIKYLQERRTALISAAVTGKIDVRDWVAPDAQNVEEPQEATA